MVKVVTLEEIKGITVIGGQITSRIEDKSENGNDTIKVLIPKAINRGSVDHKNLGSLLIKSEPDERKVTKKGDIVLKLSTPYDACIITDDDEGLLVPSFCAILRVDDLNVDKEYLVAYLNSDHCSNQIKDMVSGATIAILSTGTLKRIQILLPSLKQQKEIATNYMKALEKEKLLNKIIELEYERLNSEIYELMED